MHSSPLQKCEKTHFIESYIHYYPRIFRYVLYRIDGDIHTAEDITQEVFTRFFSKMHTLGPHAVRSWLYSASRNVLFDHYREKSRSTLHEDIDNPAILEDESLSYVENFEIKHIIDELVTSIGDPMDVMIFEYVAICGLTYRETAKLLSLPHRWIRYRYPVIIKGLLSKLNKSGIKDTGDI